MERPNRFIAYVELHDKIEKVHVKNTGRCRELLTENARVFLTASDNPKRATKYDLIAVQKGNRLINMDSQAPNHVVEEWLNKKLLFADIQKVTPEYRYKNSRFDFMVETLSHQILIEVKGVTLEKDNIVYFPDAPSERAVKHVKELTEAVSEGYLAYVIMVVQMQGVSFFMPNREAHSFFAESLVAARESGVRVLAYECQVAPGSMAIDRAIPVRLSILDEIALPLLAWYDREKRILPWRETPSPYHVWVSEIMLQQTRVEAVKPYYERFIKSLPDIESLARAKEEVLLKLWEGLGYYNRVRNLQKAALRIMDVYNGIMPQEYDELITLPGIGSYTAGAISSIACGKRVPAVDGNVLRVLARLRSDLSDISRPEVKSRIERELKAVIPAGRAGDFNQALMELGAVVCIPGGLPKCEVCPWEKLCSAHLSGRETDFPVKAPKKNRKKENKTVLVIEDDRKVALKKRPEKGLLAGMHEFPTIEGHLSGEEVLNTLKEMGLQAIQIKELPDSRHIFTHIEWYMKGYLIRVDELSEPKGGADNLIFADRMNIQKYFAIPAAYAAYTDYLDIKLGIAEKSVR